MIVNRLMTGLLLLLMTVTLFGSESEEIMQRLPSLKGKKKLAALGRLCVLSQETGDYDDQWRTLDNYLQEARRQGDTHEESDARKMRMILFYNTDQNDSVYRYARSDIEFMRKSKEWESAYRVWHWLVNTYVYGDSVTIGLREGERMYEDAKERKDRYGMGLAYSAMGNAYFNMNNMEEASGAYQKAIDLLMKKSPVPMELSNLFSSLCDVLERTGSYDRLEQLTRQWKNYLAQMHKDYKISEDYPGTTQMWAYYYIGCAQAALGKRQLEQAEAMLSQARTRIFTEDDDTYRSWLFYRTRLFTLRKEYHEALACSNQLMKLQESVEDMAETIRTKQQRAEILSHLGRDAQAVAIYREIVQVKDSINVHDTKTTLAEMNTIYKVDDLKMRQAQEQARLKMEQARQQMQSTIIIASIIVLALVIFIYFRYRAAKRLKAAHTKLEETHSQLLTAYDQLEETTTAKERIESDLRIARNIQMGMVPHTFPERDDVDLYASMTPAKEVGGDLYDYLIIGDKLYFCLGDVSGKGVPASLFMAMARNMFHVLAQQDLQPAEIATRMNNALSEDNESSMFVTMFIGVADLHTGHLGFCNAGHNPPVLIDQGTTEFVEMIPNAPIGLWPGLDYEGEEIGDITGRPLFVYTDGLNEAENRQQEQFTDERLLELLASTPFESSRQTIEMLRQEVEKHRDGAEPNDDLTMLCVKVTRK